MAGRESDGRKAEILELKMFNQYMQVMYQYNFIYHVCQIIYSAYRRDGGFKSSIWKDRIQFYKSNFPNKFWSKIYAKMRAKREKLQEKDKIHQIQKVKSDLQEVKMLGLVAEIEMLNNVLQKMTDKLDALEKLNKG